MTSQSPRIYTYKITFEEVPYYYYGVKKEKKYNEEYWGSPVTNKWCWELYTPKKQILELFEFDDGGYIKAQEIEKRLIKPVLNDKCCLNENVGGITSLKISRETALKNWREGKGLASISLEKRKEVASKTADVAGDGIIVEVKRRDGGLIVETWLQQAERSRVRPIDVPIVMARADNCAWIVSLRLADLGDFVQVIESHRKQRE